MERNGWIRAEISLKSVKPMSKKPTIFSVGGFTATSKDGREFRFDWEEQYGGCEIVDGFGTFDVQLRAFDDNCYAEDNKNNGVDQLSISPEFINDSQITEAFYECYMKEEDEAEGKCELLEVIAINFYGEFNGESQDVNYPEDKLEILNIKNNETQTA
jgi:hypothetical protein